AGGGMTDSAALSVVDEMHLWAENDTDIVFDETGNNLDELKIYEGNDATIVNGVDRLYLGYTSYDLSPSINLTGNLNLTANGTIEQQSYNYNSSTDYNRLVVGGNATFTVTAANSNLFLGPSSSSIYGNKSDIAGTVTIAKSGLGSYTDFFLRNGNAAAGAISGLATVGTLDDVVIVYDSAANIDLPGMTVDGNLYVKNGTGSITQSGAIVVDNSVTASKGITTFWVNSTKDITLTEANNDFHQIKVERAGNVTLVDKDDIDLYGNNTAYDDFYVYGDLDLTAGGNITDTMAYSASELIVAGISKLTSGSNNITLDNYDNQINQLQIVSANNVVIDTDTNLTLLTSDIAGTFEVDCRGGESISQAVGATLKTGGNTTFRDFYNLTLDNSGNTLGALYLTSTYSYPTVRIREDDAITQWTNWYTPYQNIYLTTEDDQAITLDNSANQFNTISVTQINDGNASPGTVSISENGSMSQAAGWTTHGDTTIYSNSSIYLNRSDNVLAPLKVTGGTTYLYENDTIEDFAAWSTGTTYLNAYNEGVSGKGNIVLDHASNIMGDLEVDAQNVTITENSHITDNNEWNVPGDVVLNPGSTGSYYINLNDSDNILGGIDINGAPSYVRIYENHDITESGAWVIGVAPVYLSARTNDITLTTSGNVLGNIEIYNGYGTSSSVSITEDDAITQSGIWALSGSPVTLVAENDKAITLTNASNQFGDMVVTGGAVSIRENDNITDGGAWSTTGTTTLNPGTSGTTSIVLDETNNVLGAVAIAGTPTSVSIAENDSITQASAWNLSRTVGETTIYTPAILSVTDDNDILLSQSGNIFGDLTLTAGGTDGDVAVTENHIITDGAAWTVGGTATLNAGATNDISLNAEPDGAIGTLYVVEANDVNVDADLDTVKIDAAANVNLEDADGLDFDTSTVTTLLSVAAGGEVTQSGAISADQLLLTGTGFATLTNAGNDVDTLAAGFSGGDLQFTDTDDFTIGTIGGTIGIGVGANDVSLTSVNGTLAGISDISNLSSSLTISTGTALDLPDMIIGGAQTYTAGGTGITLNNGVQSSAAGDITFNSPVSIATDLTIQTKNTTNSDVIFHDTVAGGNNILTINADNGQITFDKAISGFGETGDAAPVLVLTAGGTGTLVSSTLESNSGLAITGPVTFRDTVTLADGTSGSVFSGQVTLGKDGGMDLSGYDGLRFSGGVVLENGAATIKSNSSLLTFENENTINGAYGLTLDSGTSEIIGLDHVGTDLTSLSVTADEVTIPIGGLSIAGPQTYTSTGGTDITLNGDVAATAAGAITFNSPVTVGAEVSVTSSDSTINFESTVDGANDLTVNAGTGTTNFKGEVGSISALGDGTGAALTVASSGTTNFDATVETRSGIVGSGTGAVVFDNDVTLADGDTGSSFTAAVTLGRSGETASFSGFDGLSFAGGINLTDGAVSIVSNGSTLSFGDTVSGAQNLTLNALADGAGTVVGLGQIASDLTSLDVTGQTLSLPSGLAISGPMNFTAPGGITLNGILGSAATPETGDINFNSPVLLATTDVSVNSATGAITFDSTIDGSQNLAVNTSGTTTFDGVVGGSTPLSSLTTDSGGTVVVNGGAISTTGSQSYADAMTLGADTVFTGTDISFSGPVDGAYALAINGSGVTTFAGLVGDVTPLTSLTTDSSGSTSLSGSALTTINSITLNDAVSLAADVTLNTDALVFATTVNGAKALTANGADSVTFSDAIGGTTALASVETSGNALTLGSVTTSGTQTYTAPVDIDLSGTLTTSNSDVTVTGPVTLLGDSAVTTGVGGGHILFSGATSTINGSYALQLAAGTGDVSLGGVVGGLMALDSTNVTGNNLTLPRIVTDPITAQTYEALNDLMLSQSRTVAGAMSFTADADDSGSGSFILLDGVSLNATNSDINIVAADFDLQGSSFLSSGSGLITISTSTTGDLSLGEDNGGMHISGAELERISTSGGLTLQVEGFGPGEGILFVDNISAANSNNISGVLTLSSLGTGDINFVNNSSTFNELTTTSALGLTSLGQNITTTNDDITFETEVLISGASEVNSGGGNIDFDSTVAVSAPLTLTTANGVLTFSDSLSSDSTLLLNLDGGSVVGLDKLQNTLTGLTVNSDTSITLPAITIAGPQTYNTGVIEVTGNLGGVGLSFNNIVNVTSDGLELDSGTGLMTFDNTVNFNTNDIILSGDEIDFTNSVNGSGELTLQPSSATTNIAVNGTDNATAALDMTSTDLGWLPATLARLNLGRVDGSGRLNIAATTDLSSQPISLNGAGGISQSAALTADSLSLFSNGAITLNEAANSLGAIAISGVPTAVTITDSTAITQSSAWQLATAPVTLNAGTNNISLNSTNNTFGSLALTGGTVGLYENAATDLATSGAIDTLTVVSAGSITTSGQVTVANDATFKTVNDTAQGINLADGSTFGRVTALTRNAADSANTAGAIAIAPGNSAQLNQLKTAGNVTLTAAAGETLTQVDSSVISASGLELLGTGTHDLTLGTNTVDVLAGDTAIVSLKETDGFSIGTVSTTGLSASGNVSFETSGAITQTQAIRAVRLDVSGASGVILNHADNDIDILGASLTDSSLKFTDTDDLVLSTINLGSGDLSVTAGGDVSQNAALDVAGLKLFGSSYFELMWSGNQIDTLAANVTKLHIQEDSGFDIGTVDGLAGLSATDVALLSDGGSVTQSQAVVASNLALQIGTFDLDHTDNDIDVLAGSASSIRFVDRDNLTVGSYLTQNGIETSGNAILQTAGELIQTQPLVVGGDLSVTTTHAAGNVSIDNAAASETVIGDSLIGGEFNLIATGDAVTQAAGSGLKVAGTTDITSGSVSFGGTGNIFGDTVTTPARAEMVASGVITLGDITESGDYSVTSVASADSFSGPGILGNAVTLLNPANDISGSIQIITAAPAITDAGDVKTGINQSPGTSISIAGTASFTAEPSTVADSGVINLSNAGNSFGALVLTGSDVTITEDTGDLVIASVDASGALSITSTGNISQTGPISASVLTIDAAGGSVSLSDVDNEVTTLTVTADGDVAYVDSDAVEIAGLSVTADNVSLTAGGDLTQSGALTGVSTLSLDAGGSIDLDEEGIDNEIGTLGTVSAANGFAIRETLDDLTIDGDIEASSGNVLVHAAGGNLVLADTRTVTVHGSGNVYLVAGPDAHFINSDSTPESSALILDSGRFIVYTDNYTDVVTGGLSGSGYMKRTYPANPPVSVIETGNLFFYNDQATLTFAADDKSKTYGDANPTLTYTISGLLPGDEESDVFGGAPSLSTTASASSNAGDYVITVAEGSLTNLKDYLFSYVSGTLSVDKRAITLSADAVSKTYGDADPALTYSGSISLI
ncbi:MAG: hypothetical protein C0618_10910, partial [Desulfuromonas sp.]